MIPRLTFICAAALMIAACDVGGNNLQPTPFPTPSPTPTFTPTPCVDIDGDGTCSGDDCDDFNANVSPELAEICNDGRDNDCNDAADCDDSASCAADPCCSGPPTETDDANGLDDHADTLTDCADPDCAFALNCIGGGETNCTDDLDDDGDGMVNWAGSDCLFSALCVETDCTDEVSVLSHDVEIPAGASSATLSCLWGLGTADSTTTPYDFGRLEAFDLANGVAVLLNERSNVDKTNNLWLLHSVDLSSMLGSRVRHQWRFTTDISGVSSWFLDDVALTCN